MADEAIPSDKNGDQAIRNLFREEELKDFLNLSPDRGSLRLTAEGVAWVRDHLDKLDELADIDFFNSLLCIHI